MDKFLTHLAEKRGKLQKQLQKLQGEIADLDKAERLYRDSGASAPAPAFTLPPPPPPPPPLGHTPWPLPPPAPSPFDPPQFTPPPPRPGLGKTIKERVIQLLELNPAGLTSSQILNNLNIDGGPAVSRESLSPQLSRLRTSDRKIDLDQGVWSLQKHENPVRQDGVFE